MSLKEIAAIAVAEDAASSSAPAEQSAGLTDLQLHDRRFHPRGFDSEKGSCEFREHMAKSDKVDSALGSGLRELPESGILPNRETEHGRLSGFSPIHLATQRRGRFSALLAEALGFAPDRKRDTKVGIGVLRKIFEACSPDGVQRRLFEKVAQVSDNLGVDYKIDWGTQNGDEKELGYEFGGHVVYHGQDLDKAKEDEIPATILHEMIHGVTSYAIDISGSESGVEGVAMPHALHDSVRRLRKCYRESSERIKGEYGAQNLHEYVAELSNRSFRDKLRGIGLLRRTYNSIVGIFRSLTGWDRPASEDEPMTDTERALISILDNADKQSFAAHRRAADRTPATDSTTKKECPMNLKQIASLALAEDAKEGSVNVQFNQKHPRDKVGKFIEVYRSDAQVLALPYTQRIKVFRDVMSRQYLGRTARFEKNGQLYYATFGRDDVQKNIYGDKKSDAKGHSAKINAGASGDMFDLVEAAEFDHSTPESGKDTKSHKDVKSWDYYTKTVCIDGTFFDVLINVRDKGDNQYVYDVQLRENKNIEPVAPEAVSPTSDSALSLGHPGSTADIVAKSFDAVNSVPKEKRVEGSKPMNLRKIVSLALAEDAASPDGRAALDLTPVIVEDAAADAKMFLTSDLHTTDIDSLDPRDAEIVVIAGDIMGGGMDSDDAGLRYLEKEFFPWCREHADKDIVVTAGNHDKFLFRQWAKGRKLDWPKNVHYLVDKGETIGGLKFYGTPWCLKDRPGRFEGTEEKLKEYFSKIPKNLDVLISHSPPYIPGEKVDANGDDLHEGSKELTEAILEKKPRLCVCGHVHSGSRKPATIGDTKVMNVSRVNYDRSKEDFRPQIITFRRHA